MTTTNKPMTGEQLDELMTVAVNMQRDSEKVGERPAAMFAYAVQVAVLELRKVRDDAAALAAENAALKQSELEYDATCREEFGSDWVTELTETPATDAYLAEVRAQGVEMFGQYHNFSEKLFIQKEAKKFASQLRQGGAG